MNLCRPVRTIFSCRCSKEFGRNNSRSKMEFRHVILDRGVARQLLPLTCSPAALTLLFSARGFSMTRSIEIHDAGYREFAR